MAVRASQVARALAVKEPTSSGSFLSGLFGGHSAKKLPPLSVALPGVEVPGPPAAAPPSKTQIHKCENGAIIASENTPGATLCLGVYLHAGSKFEGVQQAGCSHLMERLAFRSTHHRSHFRVTREAEAIGAFMQANANREQMSFTLDTLKSHLPEAVDLLVDCVANPEFLPNEVKAAKEILAKDIENLEKDPTNLVNEMCHNIAFSGGLSRPMVCPKEALKGISPGMLRHFAKRNFTAPRFVLAAAGCDHEQLKQIAEPLLAALPPGDGAAEEPTKYLGGYAGVKGDDNLTHMSMAFHFEGGWRDLKSATTLTVLNLLMGGGGSFSAGGPGKGMYSRLYMRVLNRFNWAQNCTGMSSIFNDHGLIGISGSCYGPSAGRFVDVMCEEMLNLAKKDGISKVELDRAKAATQSSVLMNLESPAVVSEDIGRQVLTYGDRKSLAEFNAMIESLTVDDVAAAVEKLLKTPPTLVAYGDLADVPRMSTIESRFG